MSDEGKPPIYSHAFTPSVNDGTRCGHPILGSNGRKLFTCLGTRESHAQPAMESGEPITEVKKMGD